MADANLERQLDFRMILKSITDIRWWILLLLLVPLGCGKPKPKPTVSKASQSSTDKTTTKAVEPSMTPSEFAKSFLGAVSRSEAKPEMLSVEFKKRIAPPQFPDEKTVGYSDLAVSSWLNQIKMASFVVELELKPKDGTTIFIGKTDSESKTPGSFLLIGKPSPTTGKWEVEWFHKVGFVPTAMPLDVSGDDFQAKLSLRIFMDTLVGQEWKLNAALIALPFKVELSPGFPSDILGYNPGLLELKLKGFLEAAKNYKVLENKAAKGTYSVELLSEKAKPLAITIASDEKNSLFLVSKIQ